MSQVIYEFEWFPKLKTHIRQFKNHISRHFRLFWILWQSYSNFFLHEKKNSFLSEGPKKVRNKMFPKNLNTQIKLLNSLSPLHFIISDAIFFYVLKTFFHELFLGYLSSDILLVGRSIGLPWMIFKGKR